MNLMKDEETVTIKAEKRASVYTCDMCGGEFGSQIEFGNHLHNCP
jgi:hypothetical protein